MRKTVVDQLAEEDDDEVDQKTRWLLEMLPGTQQQHQMIAPVFRWAVDSERDRRRCSEEVEERVKEVKAEKRAARGGRAQSAMIGFQEVTRGQRRTSRIQGRVERKKLELISVEICGRGKGKGDRGKGAHEEQGGVRSTGRQELRRTMRDEEEEETRKTVAWMKQCEEARENDKSDAKGDQESQRGREERERERRGEVQDVARKLLGQ